MNSAVEQGKEVSKYVERFRQRYLETPQGQKHLASYDHERAEVQAVFADLKAKQDSRQDITDIVLYRLLPYSDTKHNREKGHRISTWPAVTKDIKAWHEGAKWQVPENWPKVANAIFELALACERGPEQADFEHFSGLPFIKGFEAGMLSPIFYCLRPGLLALNSKTVNTINFLFALRQKPDRIDRYLINYLNNIALVRRLLDLLGEPAFSNYDIFDMFCHFMCDKRLDGVARKKDSPPPPIETEGALPNIEKEIGTPAERYSHNEVQWLLIELGANLGCDVWVARNDQGKSFKGKAFCDYTLAHLPRLGFDQDTTRIIEYIDVIWLKGSAIVTAFEIEHTTSIYSGILRLADLITTQPNVHVDLFIVAPQDRYTQVIREINRPTFSSYALQLPDRCRFLSYEAINQLLQGTADYAGYLDAQVIHKFAQACRKGS